LFLKKKKELAIYISSFILGGSLRGCYLNITTVLFLLLCKLDVLSNLKGSTTRDSVYTERKNDKETRPLSVAYRVE
jgi:hypothetical protein